MRHLTKTSIAARAAILACGLGLALAACTPTPTGEATKPDAGVLNIYSSRHYDGDKLLYAAFEKETGIRVQTVEAKGEELLQRIKAEGEASPADIVITVDAGNLWKFAEAGILQPVASPTLEAAIPANLRDPQGRWFGVAKRARVIAYAKDKVKPADIARFDDLAKPGFKGRVCARPSTNVYNLSLMAARIERDGVDKARAWAKGVAANFARDPQGSDTDQLKAIAGGVCDVAIVNHYYLLRMAASPDPADQAAAAKLALVFPDQAEAGTHVNVSGAGIAAHAPDLANAKRFLEFLVSKEAQEIFAASNDEYPVITGAAAPAALTALGTFKEDPTPLAVYGARQAEAQKTFDEAGWR
jgi:iron(III) transport system substrate-binding protein